jgi:hypothetical protein
MELKQKCSTEPQIESEILMIKEAVEEVTLIDILNNKRTGQNVEARMIFTSMARDKGYTYKKIQAVLNKDHSTLIYYNETIKDVMKFDRRLQRKYLECKEALLHKEYINKLDSKEFAKQEILLEKERSAILQEENKYLVKEMEILIKQFTFDNNGRLSKVLKFIVDNTPIGGEHIIYRTIKKVFNGNKP